MKLTNEELKFLQNATSKSKEGIESSFMFMSLFTKNTAKDPVPVLQFGLAILLDKPIVLIAEQGVEIPENIKKIALGIEFFERDNPASMNAAMERITPILEKLKQGQKVVTKEPVKKVRMKTEEELKALGFRISGNEWLEGVVYIHSGPHVCGMPQEFLGQVLDVASEKSVTQDVLDQFPDAFEEVE